MVEEKEDRGGEGSMRRRRRIEKEEDDRGEGGSMRRRIDEEKDR